MTRRIEWYHFQVNPREKNFSSICACFPVVGSTQKWKCRFRPTFCPFSRLTDLVQQNQDYHRTRREQAVILSPTCIFRFFGHYRPRGNMHKWSKNFFLSDSLESGTIRFVSSWRIQRAIVWSISREKNFSTLLGSFPVVGSTQKNRKIQIGLKMTAFSRRVRW